ncbi:MAG: alpha/beta fold hydrolase [Halobacteriaceae archaeon]
MPIATRDGRELPYRVYGTGPAVALIPDATVGPWSWAWVLDALGEELKTIIYDPALPPADGDGISALAADLEAVLGAAAVRRTVLCGVGLGALVALKHAHVHGRSHGLLLLGAGADWRPSETLIKTLLDPDPIASLQPYLGDSLQSVDEEALREWRETDDPGPRGRRRQLEVAQRCELPPLHEVTVTGAVRHGLRDNVWPVEGGRELAAALPKAEFESVPDAPHLLPVAAPIRVADDLVGVVERVTDREDLA